MSYIDSCANKLCCVMLCHAMPCHVMSCNIMSVMSCHVMLRYVTSRHVMACHAMACYGLLSYVILCWFTITELSKFSRINIQWHHSCHYANPVHFTRKSTIERPRIITVYEYNLWWWECNGWGCWVMWCDRVLLSRFDIQSIFNGGITTTI